MGDRVILLDLNSTLAANSRERMWWRRNGFRTFADWIRQAERYREWLVDLLRPERVLLLTVRQAAFRDVTLARIHGTTGWTPHDAWFRQGEGEPPDVKERYLFDGVFPTFGVPTSTTYVALESNVKTRAMYARHGIRALRVPDVGAWSAIPEPAQGSLF